jgi:hypothetical protein
LEVLRQLAASAKRRRALAALPTIQESLSYLEKRRGMLDYAWYQARGYPIGSGSVESANKLVVERRLKGTGMHWARAHINPMVALRTIACSNRWSEAWPRSPSTSGSTAGKPGFTARHIDGSLPALCP